MRTAVFSIVSPNYRHYARVLMTSLARHQPHWRRFVLFVGDDAAPAAPADPADPAVEPFAAVALDQLALPQPRQFCFRYSILELNTAVKPWMFQHLFEQGFDRVVFLDPDICVYSPLLELDAAPAALLTLTPHLTGPIGGHDHPSERSILLAGAYNLGFLAVSRHPALDTFLHWWQDKLRLHCVVDIANGVFVDQKWLDLAPGLFPDVRILRHEGYNVAYWNLRQRRIAVHTGSTSVNGQPLRFLHFSGFDPADPDQVSRHQHGLSMAAVGQASVLFEAYAQALQAAGAAQCRHARYGFARFDDGTPIPQAARIAYRESAALIAAAGDDPFAHPNLFLGIRQRAPRAASLKARAGLLSYRVLSSLRPLVRLLPAGLRKNLRQSLLGRREMPSSAETRLPSARQPGLNIIGYSSRQTGVGESARLCQRACDASGLTNQLIDLDRTGAAARQAVYRASLYHANADQMPLVHGQLAEVFQASDYNIGCWHWELPELPDAWIASAQPLDELWAPSAFIQSALSRKLRIPVLHMPHGIDVSDMAPCPPQSLGVPPGRFTVLCMFDLGSVIARKNPQGAITAFRRAFGDDPAVALLVKVSQADRHPAEYAQLKQELEGLPNVHLSDHMLARAQVNGLLEACDAVLSLHRSEGFGLILAEAMALGTPVVATGWSGNMDFMDSGNSCPVRFELVALREDHGTYQAGQLWAEPDLDHAAELLRQLLDDATLRERIGQRARHTLKTRFSPTAAGLRYQRRLAVLGLLDSMGG